jgi:hypothetical protein
LTSTLLLVASGACCAAFYLVAALVISIRRPLAPPTLPATSDLGTESPAVANLLANGGKVTPEAVPATLLDLAARKIVQIEETEPHQYACRVGAATPGGLSPYEMRVLRLLQSKAAGGTVPAAALTAGPEDAAQSWLRGFRGEVTFEARRNGLCEARWPPQMLTILGLLILGAFGLVALATKSTDNQDGPWFAALALAVVTAFVSSKVFRDDAQLVLKTALPKQARWLALRNYLHEDELFASLPPTAVAVRERYLAYGAALGAAAAAVRAVPMGAENDKRAWSHYGGRWRQVTVYYPTWWPPAWGASPGDTFWRGIKLAAFGGFWLWVSSIILPHIGFGPRVDQLTRDISAGAVVVGAIALVVVGVGLWFILASVVSLLGTTEVTGDAVRLRQYGEAGVAYLAIDSGTSDRIRAWKVRPIIYSALTEYAAVTVTVTPFLGYVRSVRSASAPVVTVPAPAASI